MKMAPTPRDPQSGTVTSMIHAKLRGDIIAAALGPGARLKINEICDVYSVGLAPVREALKNSSTARLNELDDVSAQHEIVQAKSTNRFTATVSASGRA